MTLFKMSDSNGSLQYLPFVPISGCYLVETQTLKLDIYLDIIHIYTQCAINGNG